MTIDRLYESLQLIQYFYKSLQLTVTVQDYIIHYKFSSECKKHIPVMETCKLCAGISPSTRPCTGLCTDTMNSCYDEITDLTKYYEQFLFYTKELAGYVTLELKNFNYTVQGVLDAAKDLKTNFIQEWV